MKKYQVIVLSIVALVTGGIGLILLGVWFGWKVVVTALLLMTAVKADTRLTAYDDRRR